MINSSFIEEAKGSSVWFKRSIVVAIRSWNFLESLVNFFSFDETSHPLLVIFPIDVTETEHVVYDDEVVVEGMNLLWCKLRESCKCCLVAFERIVKLLNIIVEFTQCTVRYEVVLACYPQ